MSEMMQNAPLPSWQHFWQEVADVLPHVAGSLVVLLAGVALGLIAAGLARKILRMTGFDARAANLGVAGSIETIGVRSPSALLAGILQWAVVFASTIVALYLLDSRLASGLAERVLLYVPQLAGACVILVGGVLVAKFLSRSVLIAAVNRGIGPARLLSDVTRLAVLAMSIAIAFEQAQIGRVTVLVAFAIVFGGLTLAAAIAVGLALRDVMSPWLRDQFDSSGSKRDIFQHW